MLGCAILDERLEGLDGVVVVSCHLYCYWRNQHIGIAMFSIAFPVQCSLLTLRDLLVSRREVMYLMLFNHRVHSILLDCPVLALPLEQCDSQLLILLLLQECEVIDIGACKLLLELRLDQSLLLDAFHWNVESVVFG